MSNSNSDDEPVVHIVAISGYSTNEDGVFTGVKGVGKDVLAAALIAENARGAFPKYDQVKIMRFASVLKASICSRFPLTKDCMEDPVRKEEAIPEYGCSTRYLLENVGTNLVRQGMEQGGLWCQHVVSQIKSLKLTDQEWMICEMFDIPVRDAVGPGINRIIPAYGKTPKQLMDDGSKLMQELNLPVSNKRRSTLVIIPDLRFYNEYVAMKQLGAKVITVERCLPGSVPPTHVSNQCDLRMVPDNVFRNDGGLDKANKFANTFINRVHMQDVSSL